MARAIGLLISGGSIRLFSIGAAVYVANLAWSALGPALEAVSNGLQIIP